MNHTNFSRTVSFGFRLTVLILITTLLVGMLPGYTPAQAAVEPPAVPEEPETPALPGDTGTPLAEYLNADGSLNLPPGGILGSIDTTGYQLVSNPGEAPRFAAAGEQPEAPAAPDYATDSANWDPRFHIARVIGGGVTAFANDERNLYAGGSFSEIDGVYVSNIAYWNGSIWSALGTGMNSSVNALAWDGINLYAGGFFTTAGGVTANRIARWDGSVWSSLGTGMNNSVRALAWDGNNLYAGGDFTTAGTCTSGCNRIARWDGSTWSALGTGMNNSVRTLAWDGSNLYAGGDFTSAGTCTSSCNRIARWDGSTWSALGTGMNGSVYALAWDGSNLYAGGNFTSAGTCTSGCNRITRWDGNTWSALGTGMNSVVYALAWDESNLYAGGNFTSAGTCTSVNGCNYIARWDGSTWGSLQDGFYNYSVYALQTAGNILYVPGRLSESSIAGGYILSWNGSNWSVVTRGQGVDLGVAALEWDGTYLYAGGSLGFYGCGNTICRSIARWDGNTWSTLGSGLGGMASTVDLLWDGNYLYIAGRFTQAGDCTSMDGCNNIARWDGSTWSALGTGMNNIYDFAGVYRLLGDGTYLYAGGDFTQAGDCTSVDGCNGIARWDGSTWSPLGTGMNDYVSALAWDGTYLYAGGSFTQAGDCTSADGCNHIARWDGSSWSALGTGMSGFSPYQVLAMAWDGTYLYAAGGFTQAGDCTSAAGCNLIARWDGSTWSPLGNGLQGEGLSDPAVYALTWLGTDLCAGGNIQGSIPNDPFVYKGLACWNGSFWYTLGTFSHQFGFDDYNTIYDFSWDNDSVYQSLYIGGDFTRIGSKSSFSVARWRLAAIWDGGGGDNNGSTAANWSGNTAPLSTDVVIFDSTSSKDAVLDASFPATIAGIVIEESYQGTVTLARSLAITGDLVVHGGALVVADPSTASLTVGGSVLHTGGVLQQERAVNDASVAFLEITDGALPTPAVKYRGVNLDTSASDENLGDVQVTIQAIDEGEYCTDDGAASPAYAKRCYTITPDFEPTGNVVVRLWALTSELNGITEGNLSVYRKPGVGIPWVELTNRFTGNDSGAYSYAEGSTDSFSAFLLGDTNDAPTAVELLEVSSRLAPASPVVLGAAALLLGVSAAIIFRQARRKER